jgi:hypothetical protein
MSQYSFSPKKSTICTGAACECAVFSIEHVTTIDLDDGQVCPPFYDGFIWCVVSRANGRTTWRRIFLATSSVTDWRTVPEDQSRAP